MNNLLKVLEFNALGKTRSRAHIFNGVKKAAHCTFSVDLDLRVDRPSSNGLLRDSAVKHSLSKVIFSTFLSKPVHSLGKTFKRRGRGMNSIVAGVRLLCKAKSFPLRVDHSADGVRGSR